MIATSASGSAATAAAAAATTTTATRTSAAATYETWPPMVGAVLDETALTGVIVVAFRATHTDSRTDARTDGHCVLVRDPHHCGNAWALPAARLEPHDATWQDAARRALHQAGLRMCDLTPFGVVRDDTPQTLWVVAWAECSAAATANANALPIGEAAHLLAATSPLESQLCRLAARLRRNSCHRPTPAPAPSTW